MTKEVRELKKKMKSLERDNRRLINRTEFWEEQFLLEIRAKIGAINIKYDRHEERLRKIEAIANLTHVYVPDLLP